MENEILKLKDKDGNIKEYEIVLAFKWFKTNKTYIIYKDQTKDLNNEYEVYAKRLDPSNPSKLEDITTDEEWNLIEEKIAELNGGDEIESY